MITQVTTGMTIYTPSLFLMGCMVAEVHNSLVGLTRVHQTFMPLRTIKDFLGTNIAHSMAIKLVLRVTTSTRLTRDKEIIIAEIFNKIPMGGIPTCKMHKEEILSCETQ